MQDIVCQPGDLVKRRDKRQKARLSTSPVLPAADICHPGSPGRMTAHPSDAPQAGRTGEGAQKIHTASEATEREPVESTRATAHVKRGRTLFVTAVRPAPLPRGNGVGGPPRRGLTRSARSRLPTSGALVLRRAVHALLGLAHEVGGGADGAEGACHGDAPSHR